jgi:hypothetical protein
MEIEMETTMKITEKFKNYFRLGMSSIFIVALASLLMACGSGGGGGGSTSAGVSTDTGNTISGRVTLSGSATGRTLFATHDLDNPFADITVQLVDAEGNVVDEKQVKSDGSFEFYDVDPGDYDIILIDNETGETITTVEDIPLIDGDDVMIQGTVGDTSADWTIEYTSNLKLQNEAQTLKAQGIADNSDLSLEEVMAMREEGMGWGKIALENDVHPSSLGLGNNSNFWKEKETGVEKTKGKPDDTGKPDKDNGKPDDKGKPDKDNGNSGNGKGNSGNNN